jgi:hypothetical protein
MWYHICESHHVWSRSSVKLSRDGKEHLLSTRCPEKPKHLIYDSNCDAKQQVMSHGDPYFADMGICVGIWHFLNKHKVTHAFRQKHCNPAMYPELQDKKGDWYFNTLVAKQTNAWLGGYHFMCHKMLPVKFNFFLDEMIRLRNVEMLKRLAASGQHPHVL